MPSSTSSSESSEKPKDDPDEALDRIEATTSRAEEVMEAAMSDHDESMERLERANVDDSRQRAERKIEDAAEAAAEDVEEEARRVASELTGEVVILRRDIQALQKIDDFKAKVYIVGIVAAVLEVLAFLGLWFVSQDMNRDTSAIRTDLEVHRIRNEASHDCLAEKMAKLPTPEQRATAEQGGSALTRDFVQEFLGCVTAVAPTIIPPDAPNVRIVPPRPSR